jgi:hypothetical protein
MHLLVRAQRSSGRETLQTELATRPPPLIPQVHHHVLIDAGFRPVHPAANGALEAGRLVRRRVLPQTRPQLETTPTNFAQKRILVLIDVLAKCDARSERSRAHVAMHWRVQNQLVLRQLLLAVEELAAVRAQVDVVRRGQVLAAARVRVQQQTAHVAGDHGRLVRARMRDERAARCEHFGTPVASEKGGTSVQVAHVLVQQRNHVAAHQALMHLIRRPATIIASAFVQKII